MNPILSFNEFSNQLNEENYYSVAGFSADAEVISVSVEKHKYNNLMQLTISGTRTLVDMKSYPQVKDEDKYEEASKKYSLLLETLLQDFEVKLNNLILDFSNEVSKI